MRGTVMRTRQTIDHAASDKKKKDAKKRKNDSALGDRSKRCKISQSVASQVKSPPKKNRHRAAEGSTSKNGDDEVFAMTLENFVGDLRKRGAADRSSMNTRGCASLKKAIAKKHGTKESPVLIQSCDHTHAPDDHHGRDNETSTEGVAIDQCSSRNKSLVKRQRMEDSLLLRTGDRNVHTLGDDVQHHEENTSTRQGGIDGQENLTPTHYGEDGLKIVLSSQEPACVQCQSHEDGYHNEPDATLSQGKTEKRLRSRHKKKGASLGGCLDESIQGEQNGSHTTLPERVLEEQPLSCPRSGKSKCRPGNIKQFNKESIGSMPTQVSQLPNSCYSRKRLNDAKSRWKNLARSILSAEISPEIVKDHLHRLTDIPERIRSVANNKTYKTQSLPKKRRKPFTAANALAADQRPVTGRMRQKVCKQQLSLLKRMKTWLTEAKFSQSVKEENSNDVGEEFIMTEDKRHAFAQSMVKSCQKNPNMRTVFLESVRMLTLSGLMQVAASNLLQQGPCEEAQNVLNAWADFKEQSAITKTLPVNLLNAVNQLHEKRGDLSTKLSMPNVMGICTLNQIDEHTWKFKLPED